MIHHVFVFGVLLPTFITILVFVAFLVCWFKFNVKDRVLKSRLYKKHFCKASRTEALEIISNAAVQDNTEHGPTSGRGDPDNNSRQLLAPPPRDYVTGGGAQTEGDRLSICPDSVCLLADCTPATLESGGTWAPDDDGNYGHFVPRDRHEQTEGKKDAMLDGFPLLWSDLHTDKRLTQQRSCTDKGAFQFSPKEYTKTMDSYIADHKPAMLLTGM